jgi:hypothetical protein
MSTLTKAIAASVLVAGTTAVYLMTHVTRYQPVNAPADPPGEALALGGPPTRL